MQKIKKLLLILSYYLIGLTSRIINNPEEKLRELKKDGKTLLFCLWHENNAGCFWYYRHRAAGFLREFSAKGDILAAMAQHFGYADFAVSDISSDRVSIKNTIAFIRYLQAGHDGVVALDGPNGPYHVPKPGAFNIAKKSGSLLTPVGVWYSKKIILKNRWDKFQLPLPFSKIVLLAGEPLSLPEKIDEQTIAENLKVLTERVNEMNIKAEKLGLELIKKPR